MMQQLPVLASAVAGLLHVAIAAGQPQDLAYSLPTENEALYHGGKDAYYMYCDRLFEGQKSQPWEAGTYGMVRNPFRTHDGQVLYSRFHEGIDVKPLRRTADGTPLDPVRPIAPGIVAYVSEKPGLSNYGRYVVVAHELPEGTVYSLYAHLASVSCKPGQRVERDSKLGVLGYSGVGLNKRRAHCHLELCLMVNSAYEQFAPPTNKHGNFNGLNLVGINAADLLLASRAGKAVSLSGYLSRLPEHYRVRVPRVGTMDILRRHRFLYKGEPGRSPAPVSLDIAFTAEGVPLAIYPAHEVVDSPRIISCKPMPTLQQNVTVNRVKNSSKDASLTTSGLRYVNQYLWLEGKYPPPVPAAPVEASAPVASPAPAASAARVSSGHLPAAPKAPAALSPLPGAAPVAPKAPSAS